MSTLIKKGGKWVRTAIGDASMSFVRKPAWSRAESITIAQLNAGYTAPKDGLLVGYIDASKDSTPRIIRINDVTVALAYGAPTDISMGQFQVQMNQGDVATYPISTATGASISFVPFEDSIVEPEVVTPELIRNMNTPDYAHPESISAAQINAGYTVQHRGLFMFTGYNDTSGGVRVKINGVDVAILYGVVSSGPRCGYVQMPVKPGDIIKSEHVASNALLCFVAPYLAQ